jgi:hypothetical protein
MNVYKRPLFRQAGGPAQPMPQDMMMPPQGAPMPSQGAPMPPEAQQLQAVEQQAAMQGEQIGQQYAADMISNLDMAETPEDVINAIRGNQKPLDARYMELAQFVGEEDAAQTPESVLAFVQPVIMMTEQGAMDSGIGELMQGLMGDTEMSGDMAGGVGSLMAAGAQEEPAPQNFNQGGSVIKMDEGGDPALFQAELLKDLMSTGDGSAGSLKSYYNEMLPIYQEVLGQTDEDRNMAKGQAYFDVAQAGLALASGVDPRTGENMAGKPFAAQLAQASSALPAQFSERAKNMRQQDRALKAAALENAMGRAETDRQTRAALGLEIAKSELDPRTFKSDPRTVRLQDGNLSVFNVDTPIGFEDYKKAIAGGGVEVDKSTSKGVSPLYMVQPTNLNDYVMLDQNDPNFKSQFEAAQKEGRIPGEPEAVGGDYGTGDKGKARDRLNDPEAQNLLAKSILLGDQSPEALRVQNDLALLLASNPVTGAIDPLPLFLQPYAQMLTDPNYRKQVQEKYLSQQQRSRSEGQNLADAIMSNELSPQEFSEELDRRIEKINQIDLESGTGLPSGITSGVEGVVQQFSDVFGLQIDEGMISDSPMARRLLESAMQSVDQYVSQAPDGDRLLAQQYERLIKNMPKGSFLQTDADARELLDNFAAIISQDIQDYKRRIQTGNLYKGTTVDSSRKRVFKAESLEKLLRSMVNNYDNGPSGQRLLQQGVSGSKVDLSKYYTPKT